MKRLIKALSKEDIKFDYSTDSDSYPYKTKIIAYIDNDRAAYIEFTVDSDDINDSGEVEIFVNYLYVKPGSRSTNIVKFLLIEFLQYIQKQKYHNPYINATIENSNLSAFIISHPELLSQYGIDLRATHNTNISDQSFCMGLAETAKFTIIEVQQDYMKLEIRISKKKLRHDLLSSGMKQFNVRVKDKQFHNILKNEYKWILANCLSKYIQSNIDPSFRESAYKVREKLKNLTINLDFDFQIVSDENDFVIIHTLYGSVYEMYQQVQNELGE